MIKVFLLVFLIRGDDAIKNYKTEVESIDQCYAQARTLLKNAPTDPTIAKIGAGCSIEVANGTPT